MSKTETFTASGLKKHIPLDLWSFCGCFYGFDPMGFITMNPPIRQNIFFCSKSKWCKSKILKEVYGYLGCSFTPIYTFTTVLFMQTVYLLNTKVVRTSVPIFWDTPREYDTHLSDIRDFKTMGVSLQKATWTTCFRSMHPMNSCMIWKVLELFDLKPSFTVMIWHSIYPQQII